MPTIFSKIVSGEIPCYKVAETEKFLAFLDVRPIAVGHTLVIPKEETDYIFDIDQEAYAELFLFAQIVAKAIHAAVPCKKVGLAVIGLEVPHAHIHLVPMNAIGDLNFEKERIQLTPEEYTSIAASIAKGLS
jgi:histidine triad (HIT) family protein